MGASEDGLDGFQFNKIAMYPKAECQCSDVNCSNVFMCLIALSLLTALFQEGLGPFGRWT